jgi:hypothetical protein
MDKMGSVPLPAFNYYRSSQATTFAVGITDSCPSCDAGTYAATEGSLHEQWKILHDACYTT